MSTPILPFAMWESGTNQNSVPANDNSLRNQILGGLIISDSTDAQPGSPADGDAYIITGAATGTQWATFDEFDLTIFDSGNWYAFAPVEGIRVNIAGTLKVWDGAAYTAISGLPDAPSDGTGYVRKDGAWVAESGGGSGASIGVQYTSDTGDTADSDPGPGLMRWNNATQASATMIFVDDTTVDSVSMTGFWSALDAGGFLYLQDRALQDTWQIWEIITVTDAAGYVKFAVTLLAAGDAFADDADMLVTLQQGPSATGGTVTSVAVSGGTTGLSTSGGPITGSGTITLAGTLAVANGGTGQTTLAAAATALQGNGTDADACGYRGIPQVSKSLSYTAAAADMGKELYHPSGAGSGHTFTINSNANEPVEIGSAISFCNMDSNNLSIAITSDTLYLAGAGTTGTRTLAPFGTATAVKKTATTWLISGIGLT